MKRSYISLLLTGMLFLGSMSAGCGQVKETADPHIVKKNIVTDTEEDSRVRGSFTEKTQQTEQPEPYAPDGQDSSGQPSGQQEQQTSQPETETKQPESETKTEPESESESGNQSTGTGQVGAVTATDTHYDYVALGNSVTCNEISGLWWSSWGMAATEEKNDYVHRIASWLETQSYQPVTTTVLDIKSWEVAQDRPGYAAGYESYFNEYTDLVTIQTGENITEHKETLGADYQDLIARIKKAAPNAQILVLGEVLWPGEDIEASKRTACTQNGVTFVEMTEFLNDYEAKYRSAVGTEVYGADGAKHAIDNDVVAAHPNDAGMACIAQLVENQIKVGN